MIWRGSWPDVPSIHWRNESRPRGSERPRSHTLMLIVAVSIDLLLTLAAPTVARADAGPLGEQAIIGEWWTEDRDARIRFSRAETGTFTGRLVWTENPLNDTKNDDPALRARPLVGIDLIWKLRYEDGEYVDGFVYNPDDGGTFHVKVKPLDRNSLEVRGYLGFSIFGKSQVWTRAGADLQTHRWRNP